MKHLVIQKKVVTFAERCALEHEKGIFMDRHRAVESCLVISPVNSNSLYSTRAELDGG